MKLGAKKDGHITAAQSILKYQAGAFQGSPVQPGVMCAYAPYDIENVKIDSYAVYTNLVPGGGFRGYGASQTTYAIECAIDDSAAKDLAEKSPDHGLAPD